MDLKIIILSEVNQMEEDKYYDITHVESKNNTNESIHKTEIDSQT